MNERIRANTLEPKQKATNTNKKKQWIKENKAVMIDKYVTIEQLEKLKLLLKISF